MNRLCVSLCADMCVCRWLLSVILANYGAAVGFYTHYTFRHRPPLTSEAARQEAAASNAIQPPQLPTTCSISKAVSPARRSSAQSPADAGSAAGAPAGVKDTAADPDQSATAAGSEAGDGSGSEAKPTLGQRVRSTAGRVANKMRGDLWEDGNFRWVPERTHLLRLLVAMFGQAVCQTAAIRSTVKQDAVLAASIDDRADSR